MSKFKIGDNVKLKSDIKHDKVDKIYIEFENINIKRDMTFVVVNVCDSGGLGFENGWEERTFREEFFELTTGKRKERINSLFKEDSND